MGLEGGRVSVGEEDKRSEGSGMARKNSRRRRALLMRRCARFSSPHPHNAAASMPPPRCVASHGCAATFPRSRRVPPVWLLKVLVFPAKVSTHSALLRWHHHISRD